MTITQRVSKYSGWLMVVYKEKGAVAMMSIHPLTGYQVYIRGRPYVRVL